MKRQPFWLFSAGFAAGFGTFFLALQAYSVFVMFLFLAFCLFLGWYFPVEISKRRFWP